MVNTEIRGTGSYLPELVLTSEELAKRLDVDDAWIERKTRIRERRIAAPHEATSDLATHAARRALASAGVDPEEVDIIIVATSTPDRPMPATACTVQSNLGTTRAAAFDVDAVCTGFVYALSVAHSMLIADPRAQTALVIGADTYSRILNYADRSTSVLFGDGAGAVIVGKRNDAEGIRARTLGADGAFADLVQIPAGGSRMPPTRDTVDDGLHHFAMRGREVRDLTMKILPELISDLLADADMDLSEIDVIVPHQANGVMLLDWARELGVRPDVMHTTVERYGNTGAASIPITLDDAVKTGRIASGANLVFVALGGGVTWGGVALTWTLPGPPQGL